MGKEATSTETRGSHTPGKVPAAKVSENSQKDLEARAKMGKIWADEFRE